MTHSFASTQVIYNYHHLPGLKEINMWVLLSGVLDGP